MTARGMSKSEAAAYCCGGVLSTFDDWVRRGILPGPIPKTHRWDRRAIDAALDRASGLETTIAPSPLQEWQASRAREAQGGSPGPQDARER